MINILIYLFPFLTKNKGVKKNLNKTQGTCAGLIKRKKKTIKFDVSMS